MSTPFVRLAMLLFVMTAFLATSAHAQQQARGQQLSAEERVDRMMQQFTEQLSLTDEQVTQIRPIVEWQIQETTALREKAGGDRQEMRTMMQSLREETDAQILPLLTEEQAEKYRELPRGPRGRRGNG